jgi:dolichyl-phosphate beta-glucosyltransferase
MTVLRYSIILPVYNEAERLKPTLEAMKLFLATLESWELLIVDDGSQDNTVAIAEGFQSQLPLTIIKLPINSGKGWAVRQGMLAAKGNYRAFLDADLATLPAELSKLFKAIDNGADVAIGSRIQADGTDLRVVGRKRQPLPRRILGKLFRLVATRPFLGTIRDSQCGAKAFTGAAAELLFAHQQIKRWAFDIEILFLAKKAGLKVVEIPVQWENVENSKLKPSVTLAFDTLKELLQIAWVHRGTKL